MAKKSKKTEAQEEEVLAEEAEASTEESTPADPLEEAERERDEMRQNWQRARADFQNLKRRILEDIEVRSLWLDRGRPRALARCSSIRSHYLVASELCLQVRRTNKRTNKRRTKPS